MLNICIVLNILHYFKLIRYSLCICIFLLLLFKCIFSHLCFVFYFNVTKVIRRLSVKELDFYLRENVWKVEFSTCRFTRVALMRFVFELLKHCMIAALICHLNCENFYIKAKMPKIGLGNKTASSMCNFLEFINILMTSDALTFKVLQVFCCQQQPVSVFRVGHIELYEMLLLQIPKIFHRLIPIQQ